MKVGTITVIVGMSTVKVEMNSVQVEMSFVQFAMSAVQVEMNSVQVATSTVQFEMSSVQVGMSTGQVAMSTVQFAMNTGQFAMSAVQVGTSSQKVEMSTVTVETVHAKKMSPDLPKHFRINHGVAGLAPIAATTKRMLCGWVVHMPCFFLFEMGGLAFGNPNSMHDFCCKGRWMKSPKLCIGHFGSARRRNTIIADLSWDPSPWVIDKKMTDAKNSPTFTSDNGGFRLSFRWWRN